MKKVVCFIMFLAVGMVAQAQEFKIGVNAGIPVGDADAYTSFNLGADASYLFAVGEGFSAGPMIGVSHFFGKELGGIEVPDVTFLPIAASGRIGLNETFFLGADLGYAVGINEGNEGGFYYRPKVGYNLGNLNILLSYSGVSNNGSISSINAGVEFDL